MGPPVHVPVYVINRIQREGANVRGATELKSVRLTSHVPDTLNPGNRGNTGPTERTGEQPIKLWLLL